MATDKHVRWFGRGATALRLLARAAGTEHLFPSADGWYQCPTCPTGAIFTVDELLDPDGHLTVEHVPPDKLGGQELLLTCKTCNNASGTHFDADAVEQEKLRAFAAGVRSTPERSFFSIGGTRTRADVYHAGGGVLIVGLPGQNNPAETRRQNQYLEWLHTTGSTEFTYSIEPVHEPSPGHAHVSWVRTGYLAAFALFGYSYALSQEFDPVREQLANPSALTLPPLVLYDPAGDPAAREIRIIEDPADYRSVSFVWGQHQIFMPHPSYGRSLADLSLGLGLSAGATGRLRLTYQARVRPWPTEPLHLLDPRA